MSEANTRIIIDKLRKSLGLDRQLTVPELLLMYLITSTRSRLNENV